MSQRPLGVESGYNAAVWPPLTKEEIAAALPHWAVRPARDPLLWHSRRPFSASAIIALEGGGRLFLKRHSHALRTTETLSEEHRFALHLAAHNMPVCAPLRMADGQTALAQGDYVYEAFPLCEELDAYRGLDSWRPYHTQDQAASSGHLLARLHQASEGYDAPARQNPPLISAMHPLLSDDLPRSLLPWAASQKGLAPFLSLEDIAQHVLPLLEPFHRQLRPYFPQIQPLWGHGDWHGANLLWQPQGPAHHQLRAARAFDFGMCDRSCAPFDLAVAIERSFISWLDLSGNPNVHREQLTAFLRAYDHQRPRSPIERTLTALWLPLCHVTFALSEITYYDALLHDPASATIAYKDYLIGHARWFEHGIGAALCAWLKDEPA